MVHLGACRAAPLFDAEAGIDGLVEAAAKICSALAGGGLRRGDVRQRKRPPLRDSKSTPPLTAAMAAMSIGRLRSRDHDALRRQPPVGSDGLDFAVAAATGAAFVREIFTGVVCLRHGRRGRPTPARRLRYRKRLDRNDLALLYNVSAEFAYSLDRRSLADRARSAGLLQSIPDAILVSGAITGEAREPRGSRSGQARVARARRCSPTPASSTPPSTTSSRIADGCIVGSALKIDGDTWKPVDPERASEFMRLARAARGRGDARVCRRRHCANASRARRLTLMTIPGLSGHEGRVRRRLARRCSRSDLRQEPTGSAT